MSIEFVKMQATGNDFVLVDERRKQLGKPEQLARAICQRHFGVGADGLLVVGASESADARMRMFNPDGTEDMCGNGVRCVVRYVREDVPGNILIDTISGIVPGQLREDRNVSVILPPPSFRAADLPANVEDERLWDYPLQVDDHRITIYGISTGTPHVIILCKEPPADDLFQTISPRIECHPLFPKRTSVLWVSVIGQNSIWVRVWERGAGETFSCGTGTCAAVAVTSTLGLTDSSVKVTMRGGTLHVDWRTDRTIKLTGPAEFVFRGMVNGD